MKETTIGVRIDPDLLNALNEAAEYFETTKSEFIRSTLRVYFGLQPPMLVVLKARKDQLGKEAVDPAWKLVKASPATFRKPDGSLIAFPGCVVEEAPNGKA